VKKHLIVILCFVSFALSGQKATIQSALIPQDKLKEDLDLLRYNFETMHGAMYVYNSKELIDQKFDEIRTSLDKPMSSIDFYRIVAPILSLIGNGHTHVVPSKEAYELMRNELKLLPLDLYMDGKSVYLLRNCSKDQSLLEGTLIKSINGRPIMELINELAGQLTRDGVNESWPMKRATNAFSQFYAFQYGDAEIYNCVLQEADGSTVEVAIEGLNKNEIKAIREKRYELEKPWHEKGEPPYTLEIEGTTAVMTLGTFSLKEIKKGNKMKSKKWFQQSFAQINEKGVEKLIIDLRDNGGGDEDPTIELFSHLYDKEFTFYKDVFLENRKIPNGKLYEDNAFFLNLYAKLVTKKKGDKFVLKANGLKPYQPAKEQYAGEVIVLTDPGSFSATGEMTAILKEHDRATFVGEEPGGNPNQNTSGMMLILTLPHSGLRAVVPTVVFEMNISFENTGRGVIPDYEVKNSISEEIKGVDSVMKFAKEL